MRQGYQTISYAPVSVFTLFASLYAPNRWPGLTVDAAEFVKLFDGDPQSSHKVCAMQQLWDAGYYVDMSSMNEPYTAALLLKVFLQRLPEPLFTTKLIPAIISLNTRTYQLN